MNPVTATLVLLSAIFVLSATSSPISGPYDESYFPEEYSHDVRARRSPQSQPNRGSVVISGSHQQGQHGMPSQQSVRGDYNHNLWRGRNGATVDANAFYQRNWGSGPRQDYGGGVRLNVPFGK